MMNWIFQWKVINLKKIIEIMENAVRLETPNKVDYEFGENWGNIYD